MAVRYPREVHDYIRKHYKTQTRSEMVAQLNAEYGTDFTKAKMKAYMSNHKLTGGKREEVYSDVVPRELDAWIRKHVKGKTTHELAEMAQAEGWQITRLQLRSYMQRNAIKSGVNCQYKKGNDPYTKGKKWEEYMSPEALENAKKCLYPKGHVSENKLPLGTITKTKDGYLLIKVKEKGGQWDRWALLHRVLWEQANGPIPPGMMITFLDGNKDNVSLENLALISLAENAILRTKGYRSSNPEITQAGITTAKISIAIKKKRGKKNGASKRQTAGPGDGEQQKNETMEE